MREIVKRIQKIVGTRPDGILGVVTATAILDSLLKREVKHQTSETFRFDSRTEKNLETLDPKAQIKFRAFIAQAQTIASNMGYKYIAISGNRSYKQQDALYAKGRTTKGSKVTNAKGGYSNHNFGIALDFGVFNSTEYLDATSPKEAHKVHASVAQVAEEHGIEWGGNWRSFKDTPHYQIKTGLTNKQKRKLMKEKGGIL